MKIVKNAKVFFRGKFISADIGISEGRISAIGRELSGETLYDADGCRVLPGLVDIHIHACNGTDFCDGNDGDLENIATFLAKQGVTSFLGTSMSFDEETLTPLFERAGRFCHLPQDGMATMWGINMEGPYINKAKKGAQSENNIFSPDFEAFSRLYDTSFGTVRLVDVAPECEGAIDFIRQASQMSRVSIAHTSASYDQAVDGMLAGATHVTHLFNAMPPFAHRDPGVVGAASDYASYVEIISDGVHIHPSVIRTVFEGFKGRVCLISDATCATGLADGEYMLGGQKIYVKGDKSTLADGTIAGSTTTLADCMRRAISFGVPMDEAIISATINPAKAAEIDGEIGSIEVGKRADLLITDYELNTKAVYVNGIEIPL